MHLGQNCRTIEPIPRIIVLLEFGFYTTRKPTERKSSPPCMQETTAPGSGVWCARCACDLPEPESGSWCARCACENQLSARVAHRTSENQQSARVALSARLAHRTSENQLSARVAHRACENQLSAKVACGVPTAHVRTNRAQK